MDLMEEVGQQKQWKSLRDIENGFKLILLVGVHRLDGFNFF